MLNVCKEATFDSRSRPHVVILGAGASKACIFNGDYYGRQIPLMNELINVSSIKNILEDHGYSLSEINNFEQFYSEVYDNNETQLMERLEKIILEFFQDLRLPELPTVYDYLICSLRSKDLIATFNWDPLLMQAYMRCPFKFKPKLLFLHGNVSVGYCEKDHISAYIGHRITSKGNLIPLNSLHK